MMIIDNLQYANWSEKIFKQMREGKVDAVHVTISYHETFRETVLNFEKWNRWFEKYSNMIVKGSTAADIDLAKKTSAEVIANADLCSYLATKGLNKFNQGNTGGTIVYDKFSVTFVQAHHSSSTVDENGISHSLGFSNGLVFHIKNEKTVYHMGDTDIFGDMQLIEELHKPDIGIVPIGDRFTMGGAVAALSCKRYFNFSTDFPTLSGMLSATGQFGLVKVILILISFF